MAGILVESEHQLSWFEFELSLTVSFSEPLIISLLLYSPISYIVLIAKVFFFFSLRKMFTCLLLLLIQTLRLKFIFIEICILIYLFKNVYCYFVSYIRLFLK